MNMDKTKFIHTNSTNNEVIPIDDITLEKVDSYVFLAQKICPKKENIKTDLRRRISLSWTAFAKMTNVFCSVIPNTLKAQPFHTCILPMLTYSIEAWALNKGMLKKIQVMSTTGDGEVNFGCNTNGQKKTKEWICKKSRVTDAVE